MWDWHYFTRYSSFNLYNVMANCPMPTLLFNQPCVGQLVVVAYAHPMAWHNMELGYTIGGPYKRVRIIYGFDITMTRPTQFCIETISYFMIRTAPLILRTNTLFTPTLQKIRNFYHHYDTSKWCHQCHKWILCLCHTLKTSTCVFNMHYYWRKCVCSLYQCLSPIDTSLCILCNLDMCMHWMKPLCHGLDLIRWGLPPCWDPMLPW